jgi:hypothetical protein
MLMVEICEKYIYSDNYRKLNGIAYRSYYTGCRSIAADQTDKNNVVFFSGLSKAFDV